MQIVKAVELYAGGFCPTFLSLSLCFWAWLLGTTSADNYRENARNAAISVFLFSWSSGDVRWSFWTPVPVNLLDNGLVEYVAHWLLLEPEWANTFRSRS